MLATLRYGISLTTTTAAQPHFGKLRDIFKVTQDIILLLLHDGEEIILAELINGWFPNNKLQYNQKDEVSLFALTSSFLISIFFRRLPINLAKCGSKFAGICIP